MKIRLAAIGTAFSLLAVLQTAAFGQSSKGILAGTVRDKTYAAVGGAKVTVTSEDTLGETRTDTTSPVGAYRKWKASTPACMRFRW